MKKLSILVLVLILCGAMAACGCMNSQETSTPTTETPTTATPNTTAPSAPTDTMPTLETNIPDPSVDTSMPDMTDGTDDTTNDESIGRNRPGSSRG